MTNQGTAALATVESAGSEDGITLIIHAGAGDRGKHHTPERSAQVKADLTRALDAGYAVLEAGGSAEDAVIVAIHVMEDAPEFNAGRGAALTSDGLARMDACLMDGDGSVGAVAGVSTVKNPIDAAKAVKDQTKHVLFADPTDEEIAAWGVETRPAEYFVTEARKRSLAEAQAGGDAWAKHGEINGNAIHDDADVPGAHHNGGASDAVGAACRPVVGGGMIGDEKHGTIGAVARDAAGRIAAGTSTGGITNQMHGRVGDSPLPGCGTFADQRTVAVSCTGIGEAFIKAVAAHQVSDRVRFAGESVHDAAVATLAEVASHHGDGGMIVLPATGRGAVAYNSEMMNFGYRSAAGKRVNG
ncbi:isoaspartyl peptidase/L-asparaginase family protein [Bifidobacterium biavatii]|uniref:L-asparaginase n=1 Tax=Bifidobacterium biavatii DSM 23969 TaxID=1437608 RepID=A0A087A118_9BIFI|nr:isoaspartyl peptidase/L-asparaginase [Bifidobacterium biavatii]KFI52468.1 L-asparaginase precursor [Bifidobacterium biavatii DSM 23969]